MTGAEEAQVQRLRTLRDYYRRLERFGTTTADEEQDRHSLEAEDLAQQLAGLEREVKSGRVRLTKRASVVEELDHISSLAAAALNSDPKIDAF